MDNKRTMQQYWLLMNNIAYWLVRNNKKFNTRQVYGYQGREADYGTIIRVIKERGKSERLGIQLERGTYVLTAFIRSYEGLNPATDMKIIKVI